MVTDMKKIMFLIMAAAAALSITSCDPNESKVSAISVNAVIDESALEEIGISAESYTVTFTNANTGLTVTAESENGIATATGLTPGLYNILANASLAVETNAYILSGSASNVNLTTDGQEVTIAITATKESALIFKEIYYAGCTFPSPSASDPEATATYFRDQFYEIYNNSSETVYVDGMCIAETIFSDYTFTVRYEYPIENADDYVYVQTVWQLPGDGTQYPVAPGESIVIAQWGTNHKAESLTKGASPVDLSGAEFEAVEGESETWDGIVLTDNDAINMVKAVNARGFSIPQWLTSTSGSQYVIFKPSEPFRTTDFLTANDDPNSTALEIPITDVIDAVQAVSGPERLNFLGLPTSLDAGAVWVDEPNGYNGQSISRKISRTEEDGRVVYQDTNNTSDDFEVNDTPEVRRNGAGIPAWNTWIRK